MLKGGKMFSVHLIKGADYLELDSIPNIFGPVFFQIIGLFVGLPSSQKCFTLNNKLVTLTYILKPNLCLSLC